MLKELNDIQRYEALKKQVDELNNTITNACRAFIERHYPSATCVDWGFNDRKTLMVITYVDADKDNVDRSYKIHVSFDEIQTIIDENEPKIKGYNG